MSEKTCPQCAETVKADAKICRYCGHNFDSVAPAGTVVGPVPAKKKGNIGKGCLGMAGVFVAIIVIAAMVDSGDKHSPAQVGAAAHDQGEAGVAEVARNNLSGPQQNAVRTAQQYINMSGFSRDGLIDQLSSEAGNGYEVADATVAVDSLNIDWNEQAARSAKQYLDMTGFSCKGLIEQLSSSAGSQYTVSEATYGAKKAGAC